jgi:membrane associated rhomboid family serine protease
LVRFVSLTIRPHFVHVAALGRQAGPTVSDRQHLADRVFLAIFGKNVEDALGRLRYLAFYFAGGLVATMTQTAITLSFGTASDARIPTLGASGAIAAVLGAFFVRYPSAGILTFFTFFLVRVPAVFYLGAWFLYQLVEANFGLLSASANGGGIAFFAHVGGFIFGVLVARYVLGAGRVVPTRRRGVAHPIL